MAATDMRRCHEPAPADLRAVRTLDLADARLGALATGDLGGLPALRTLDISNNALSALPALPEATTHQLRLNCFLHRARLATDAHSTWGEISVSTLHRSLNDARQSYRDVQVPSLISNPVLRLPSGDS